MADITLGSSQLPAQSVTTAENTSWYSDQADANEKVQANLESFISVSDSTTTSETTTLIREFNINVSDTTVTSEVTNLVYNISLNDPTQLVDGIRTNLVLNPSFESGNDTEWTAWSPGTISTTSSQAYIGTYSEQVVTGSSSGSDGNYGGARFIANNLTIGQTYTLSTYAIAPTGTVSLTLQIGDINSANNDYGNTTSTLTSSWARYTLTFQAALTTHSIRLKSPTANATYYIDAIQLEVGNGTPYFDGLSGSGAAWTGTPNDSTSTMPTTNVTIASQVNKSDNSSTSENTQASIPDNSLSINVYDATATGVTRSLQQSIDIVTNVSNTSGSVNTYTLLGSHAVRFNPNDYDGTVTFYFEACIKNTGSVGSTAYVQLYNLTDGAAVAGTELTVGSGINSFELRLRSGAITLTGDKIYAVQVKHNTDLIGTVIGAARIIVVQSGNITKTQIHQQLSHGASVSSTSNTNVVTGMAQFLYEASKYDGSVTVRHDAAVIATSGNTTTSGIYDVTSSSVVSSSEVSTTSTSLTVVSSSNLTLTDGHVYQPTMYVSGGAAVTFDTNELVFTLTGGFTKYLAYLQVFNTAGSGSSSAGNVYPSYQVYVDKYINFDTTAFTGLNLTTYYESNLSIANSAQTAHSNLQTYVYAISSNSISGTDVTHTGDTNVARSRSSSFSMPAGANDIVTGIATSNAGTTALEWISYLILEVTGLGAEPSSRLTIFSDENIRVSDTASTSESIQVQEVVSVNKSDTTTTSETVTPLIPVLLINKSDSTTTSEYSQVNSELNVNPDADTFAYSERVIAIFEGVRGQDFNPVADYVTIYLENNLVVSDTTSTSESTSVVIASIISVNDATSTSESMAIASEFNVQLFEFLNPVSSYEFTSISAENFINKSDTAAETDNINFNNPPLINFSETAHTAESVNDAQVYQISVSDTVTTDEIQFINTFRINVSDTSNTAESVTTFEVDVAIIVSDTTVTSEFVFIPPASIQPADTTTITEDLSHYSDQADVNERVNIVIVFPFTVSDTANTAESTTVILESLVINKSDSTSTSEAVIINRNNAFEIILQGNYILDENGDYILDENGRPIFDEGTGADIAQIDESIAFHFDQFNLILSDTLQTIESTHVSIATPFLQAESFTIIIPDPYGINLLVPDPITIKVVIE